MKAEPEAQREREGEKHETAKSSTFILRPLNKKIHRG